MSSLEGWKVHLSNNHKKMCHFNLREVFLEEGQQSGKASWGSDIWTGLQSGKWTPGKMSRMCKDRRDASSKLHSTLKLYIHQLKMTYMKNTPQELRSKGEVLSTGELTPTHQRPPTHKRSHGQPESFNCTLTTKIKDKWYPVIFTVSLGFRKKPASTIECLEGS